MINGWSEVNRTDLIMSDFILWKAKRNTTILSPNTDSFHQNHGYYLKKKKFQKLILALVFSTQIKFLNNIFIWVYSSFPISSVGWFFFFPLLATLFMCICQIGQASVLYGTKKQKGKGFCFSMTFGCQHECRPETEKTIYVILKNQSTANILVDEGCMRSSKK